MRLNCSFTALAKWGKPQARNYVDGLNLLAHPLTAPCLPGPEMNFTKNSLAFLMPVIFYITVITLKA
jgi:hypothetical protein